MSLGRIKGMMLIETVIMIITLIASYIILKLGAHITSVFVLLIAMEAIIILFLVLNAKKEFDLKISNYLFQVVLPLTKVTLCLIPLVVIGLQLLKFDNILLTLIFCVLFALITCCIIYLNMTQQEKELVHKILMK